MILPAPLEGNVSNKDTMMFEPRKHDANAHLQPNRLKHSTEQTGQMSDTEVIIFRFWLKNVMIFIQITRFIQLGRLEGSPLDHLRNKIKKKL